MGFHPISLLACGVGGSVPYPATAGVATTMECRLHGPHEGVSRAAVTSAESIAVPDGNSQNLVTVVFPMMSLYY